MGIFEGLVSPVVAWFYGFLVEYGFFEVLIGV